MKYDDAEYYFLEFETDLPNENGGRHIGLFLAWAILRGLAGEGFADDAAALRAGTATGLDLLFDRCDGKLLDDDLNEEGNAFAVACYERFVLDDFIEAMNCAPDASVDAIFGADLTPQRHARVLWQLDRRYAEWRRGFGFPSRSEMLARCVAALQPAFDAARFPRVASKVWSQIADVASFERKVGDAVQSVDLYAVDDPGWFHGVRLECTLHVPALYDAIVREKTADQSVVTSLQSSAEVPLARIADGWTGPLQDYRRDQTGFWVFREGDLAPLLAWLAARVQGALLPLLRGLDGVDALALAHGTKPMSASPLHQPRDPYPALLAAEMAKHPRLRGMLDETEAAILALAPRARSRDQDGALALIPRLRDRARGWMP
jgi:hypothetical protein